MRTYDAQIGRWTGSDPKNQYTSGYVGMGNNPISNIDKDGGWSFGLTGAVVGALAGGTAAYFIIKNNPHMDGAFKALIGVGLPLLGAGVGYGIFESLSPGTKGITTENGQDFGKRIEWTNESRNLWGNTRAFYTGLFNLKTIPATNYFKTGCNYSGLKINQKDKCFKNVLSVFDCGINYRTQNGKPSCSFFTSELT